jgi:cohesin loading factor subunit SCC2
MLHPQAVAPNRGAVNQNANLGTPKSTLSTPEKVAHVLVPGLTPSSRGDFQSFVHLEEQVPEEQDGVPSKKRKRPQAHEDPLPVTYNQQQKSDRKTDELQAFLNDIFEAEDNYESGPSASLSPAVVKFVDVNFVDGANVVVLQPDTQTRLNALIQPVLEARRFGAISEEDVIRLQNLCRGRVDAIHSGSLQIEAEWNDAELDHWLSKIQDAEYGLGAAKILLKTMTAGRAEKKIYSDDHMVSIIKAMKYSFNGIIPIVESRPTSEVFRMVSDSKQLVSKVLQRCGQVLELLGDLVANIEVSERAVTAIEVLSTKLIFVNNAISEKDSVLGSKRFELIRPIAMDVVSKIFARYEIRRRSSLTDILSSLDKLSVDRRGSRQYKMADGTAIQVVSALLMRLVQTSATISTAQQTGNKTATRSSDTDDEDEEGDSASSSTDDRAPRKKTTNRKRRNISKMGLRDIMMSLHTQMQANADFIVRFIVTRASDTPKSGDLPYRHLLEMFTEDFLSVLGSPKWPAAQAFLSKLIGHMVHILSDAKSTVPAKTMALDVMGFMGSSLIDLELLLKKECQKLDKNQSKLSALLTQLGEQLSEQLSENASKSNPGKGSRADKPSVSTSKIDLLDFEGPYRVVLEHLRGTIRGDELRSAQGCTIQDWAFNLCEVQKSEELQEEENPALLPLQRSLKSMILDPTWLAAE